ncbi:hypothetical protein E1301_Tti020412 [Triplophysa tibetana]|uniref:Ig-like domain-containing protein n=1 Tax=Triplophysa tibetana TaxID=1572043 RepID=A0A5A9NAX3_9TELE|nr:hypothetical protein E1301_Tti020412 [Triplophysa tibetana]
MEFTSLLLVLLMISAVDSEETEDIKPTLSVWQQSSVFTGDTVTLKCDVHQSSGWEMFFFTSSKHESTEASGTKRISSVSVSDGGEYKCRARRGNYYTHYSDPVTVKVEERPEAQVSVRPGVHVYGGASVTLICAISGKTSVNSWQYNWFKGELDIQQNKQQINIRSVIKSDGGEYTCRGSDITGSRSSDVSKAVTLTVSDVKASLSVLTQSSVFTGDTVTLKCDVHQSSGWEMFFFTSSKHESTEASGTKRISSVSVSDGGEYWCRARRGNYYTHYSDPVTVKVEERPEAQVSIQPDVHVYGGESVTLTCVIRGGGVTVWHYNWFKGELHIQQNKRQIYIRSVMKTDGGEYTCRGSDIRGSSHISKAVKLTVSGSKAKAELTSDTEGSVLTGNTVTLTCVINQSNRWKFYWYQHTLNTEMKTTDKNTYTIHISSVSDGAQYWCRSGRGNPVYYTDYSDVVRINVTESPKAVLSVEPDKQLFSGETVTLRCDIQTKADTELTYTWTVKKYTQERIFRCETQECKLERVNEDHSAEYSCMGKIKNQKSRRSEAVRLTVSSHQASTRLRVSPQQWLTEGDSVTLMCELDRSSTGWTFSWFTQHNLSSGYELVSDSSGGSQGNYTVSSAALKHTGLYMCGAERGDPVYHTHNSSTQPLWITGVWSSVSLIIRPNRTQHFSSGSLSLSCEDHRSSTGWTVRRYTNTLNTCASSSVRSTGTQSTCSITSLITSDSGVYWCESESGHKHHPVNISIHYDDVILDSPAHPVTEGDSLTLHCLYRHTNPSKLTAEFSKDGSVVQNQTTGDMMIISTVSKSHEGFYSCKHPERGASPQSWISVTGVQEEMSALKILSFLLAVCPYLIVTVVLVFKCYRLRDETS